MEQNKMTMQEKERLVQLLTTKFNIDELNELTILLKKDKCKVEILPIQNVSNCTVFTVEEVVEELKSIDAFEEAEYFFDRYSC